MPIMSSELTIPVAFACRYDGEIATCTDANRRATSCSPRNVGVVDGGIIDAIGRIGAHDRTLRDRRGCAAGERSDTSAFSAGLRARRHRVCPKRARRPAAAAVSVTLDQPSSGIPRRCQYQIDTTSPCAKPIRRGPISPILRSPSNFCCNGSMRCRPRGISGERQR